MVERPRPRPEPIRTLPGDRMRRGARILRWCALLLAAVSVVGQALVTYGASDEVVSGRTATDGRSSASS